MRHIMKKLWVVGQDTKMKRLVICFLIIANVLFISMGCEPLTPAIPENELKEYLDIAVETIQNTDGWKNNYILFYEESDEEQMIGIDTNSKLGYILTSNVKQFYIDDKVYIHDLIDNTKEKEDFAFDLFHKENMATEFVDILRENGKKENILSYDGYYEGSYDGLYIKVKEENIYQIYVRFTLDKKVETIEIAFVGESPERIRFGESDILGLFPKYIDSWLNSDK